MIRVGTDKSAGARLVVDLYIRPGGAVAGEHIHPVIHERFSVLQGRCRNAWTNLGCPARF